MSIEEEEKSFVSAVDDLVIVLHQVANSDGCSGSWQVSIPTFVNRGSATPPSIPSMSTHLLNNDCIGFIKRFYEQCETKNSYVTMITMMQFGVQFWS